MQRILPLLCLILLPSLLLAQGDVGLQFMPETFQSSFVNPAYQQQGRFQIALPTLSGQVHHEGFALSDLTRFDLGTESGATYDPDQLLSRLNDQNTLETQIWAMPFAFSFKAKSAQISLHTRLQSVGHMTYDRDLFALAWQGNAAYIGDTMMVGPDIEALAYRETGVGVAIPLSEKVHAGVRINLLSGLFNISTDASTAGLYTDPEFYQLTMITDYEVRAATALNIDMDSLLEGRELVYDFRAGEFMRFGPHGGISMDLGLSIRPSEALQLDLSMTSLGSITWREGARSYTSQGSVTFEGLDPTSAGWSPGGDSSLFSAVQQSLDSFLDTAETRIGLQRLDSSYRTALPARFYLSGRYKLGIVRLGAAWTGQGYRGRFQNQLSLYAGAEVGTWLNAGAILTHHFSYGSMLGIQARVGLGPVQLFGSIGNLPGLLNGANTRGTSVTMGLNLQLGQAVE